MNELIKITVNENQEQIISGRELHKFLEIKTAYKDQSPRMLGYGFVETVDFNSLKIEQVRFEGDRAVKREIIDHAIKIGIAKCILPLEEQ